MKILKKIVKVNFDLWYKHMTPQRFFKRIPFVLNEYDLRLSNNPDIFIYCNRPPSGKFKKVFYTCDNVRPDTKNSDLALAFDYEDSIDNNTYLRFPNYARLGAGIDLINVKKNLDIDKLKKEKTKFCAFIYAHNVPIRNNFFNYLSKYKTVCSPGSCCNNRQPIGGYKRAQDSRRSYTMYEDKVKFLKKYKFAIVFENSSYPGYTTEKIYHAMLANCIPIYWGNPLIGRDFNLYSMISAYEKKHNSSIDMFEYLINRIVEIDSNDLLYEKIIRQPWYNNNKLSSFVGKKRIMKIFSRVFDV